MSTENQGLEDAFPIEIVPLYGRHSALFLGVYVSKKSVSDHFSSWWLFKTRLLKYVQSSNWIIFPGIGMKMNTNV